MMYVLHNTKEDAVYERNISPNWVTICRYKILSGGLVV